MIIVCSSLFLIFIFTYINQNSKEILYNINEYSEEQTNKDAEVLKTSTINFKMVNYMQLKGRVEVVKQHFYP